MKIAVLGPAGTFSHEAALKFNKDGEMVFVNSIWDVFETLEKKKADYGAVPVENSIEGGIGVTLDALMEFNQKIFKEVVIPIKHYLCGFGNLEEVEEIHSHPQALGQCRMFLHELKVKTVQASSTAAAAETVSKLKDSTKACICTKLAAELYNLKIIKSDIQDEKNNFTRFFIINETDSPKTGSDKTSLAVYPQEDRPGLLWEILGIFAKRKINLTRIESRPSKSKLGEYIFFIDIQGHRKDKLIKQAFQELKKNIKIVKIFGSYPKAI